MSYDSNDDLSTDLINNDIDSDLEQETSSSMSTKNKKEAETQCQIRKRIETLLEEKRLKELLDDSDDW